MNRKKKLLIEIFLIAVFFLFFVIFFQLQSFVVVILLVASSIISLRFKSEIKKKIFTKKTKSFLPFIFFDILIVVLTIITFGNDFFLNELNLKNYYLISSLLLFYLFFSVLPQEIIFRFLFFYRYRDYFNKFEFILLNSFIFSFCHLIYFDLHILLLSFFGNLLFTFNYMKNKSLLLVIIEHFLLGQTLIILGFFDNFNFSFIKKLYNLLVIN